MEPPATDLLNDTLYKAHEAFYERYKKLVYYRTRRRLARFQGAARREDVDDLFQETFYGVFRWLRNYLAEHPVAPPADVFERVLRTIEINEYRTYLKRVKYLSLQAVPLGPAPGYVDGGPLPRPVEPGDDSCWPGQRLTPEDTMLWREYETQLQKCLGKLKPHERLALLCKARGDSDREAAAVLGAPEKTVTHSIIPLGRKKLRKCMEGYTHGQSHR